MAEQEEDYLSETQARKIIYNTVYEYINPAGSTPSMNDFFSQNIGETLNVGGQLEGWPEFLTDAIAVDIHRTFRRRGYWIQGFSSSWLRDHGTETWEALVTHLGNENLIELER